MAVSSEVIGDARAGGRWALRALHEEYAGTVATYLDLHGVTDVQGVTASVFLEVFTRLGAIVDEEQLRSAVLATARRAWLDRARPRPWDRLRSLRRAPADDETPADPRVAALRGTLGGLAAPVRDVVLLRSVGRLPVDDVAAIVGRTPTEVREMERTGRGQLGAADPSVVPADAAADWTSHG